MRLNTCAKFYLLFILFKLFLAEKEKKKKIHLYWRDDS